MTMKRITRGAVTAAAVLALGVFGAATPAFAADAPLNSCGGKAQGVLPDVLQVDVEGILADALGPVCPGDGAPGAGGGLLDGLLGPDGLLGNLLGGGR